MRLGVAFAVNPLGIYGIEPQALLGQKAGNYPHSSIAAAGFYSAIVVGNPVAHLFALVPGCVVLAKEQRFLTSCSEPFGTVVEKLRGYGTYRTAIHEPQPYLFELGKVRPELWTRVRPFLAPFRVGAQDLPLRPVCKFGRSKRENHKLPVRVQNS